MELVTESEYYAPNIDDHGNYIDHIPNKRLRCFCGSRKDKVYETSAIFSAHCKSKTHQKWLEELNLNKANYYVKNEELNRLVHQQQMIIANLEKELQNKNMTVNVLTRQLFIQQSQTVNLLDFD
jgi:hypothetical protein